MARNCLKFNRPIKKATGRCCTALKSRKNRLDTPKKEILFVYLSKCLPLRWMRPVCPWRDLDNTGGCGHHWSDPTEKKRKTGHPSRSRHFYFEILRLEQIGRQQQVAEKRSAKMTDEVITHRSIPGWKKAQGVKGLTWSSFSSLMVQAAKLGSGAPLEVT